MAPRPSPKAPKVPRALLVAGCIILLAIIVYAVGFSNFAAVVYDAAQVKADQKPPALDKAAYNARMLALAHITIASTTLSSAFDPEASTTASTSPHFLTAFSTASTSVSILGKLWPHPAAYPNVGALLPFNRIVAYYGNFYSTQMGVLGQYPPDEMITRLQAAAAEWQAADPATPVIPAIDYIAVTAQASPQSDGTYRARMPDDQIEKAIALAGQVHGIVILDVQVGKSTVAAEVPLLDKYLTMPQVELALDPEFDMDASQARPGTVIGTMDASEINWAAQHLAQIVRANNLPPKILVVHRFTEDMVTHASAIKPLPEVQVVMDMDGFGSQAKKIGTYTYVVAPEPVQFTGFKLFYKNDNKPPWTMLSPQQVLSLTPSPVFIQYQ